ncbi:E3 ubiquitin-protein ligase BOI-like [Amaranthus tricolor]|uniref:E3 ubiquitin-protein ligase BOI-like n=1 Tax=Amaranthus tricolor TaxID=29722 RepID=UPI00258CFFD7|nr:E3 ubiquitin-protein ligase BOI-like [Amaranthus tricolor]
MIVAFDFVIVLDHGSKIVHFYLFGFCSFCYGPSLKNASLSHITVGCNADVVNMAGEKYTSFLNVPEIVGRSTSVFSQYKFPTTSYDNICLNDAGLVRNVLRQVPVSTGLKLAYGEEEPNTSISSAGECVMHSSTMCHNDNLLVEFARQSDEYDHFIRIQGENFRKGIAELNQRHTVSLLNALEKEVRHRMHEKDVEIQNHNQRNKELMEKMRQIDMEAQMWHLRAKQNESLVDVLRNNINHVFQQGAAALKEDCGESMADDAVSSCNQNVVDPSFKSSKELVNCKACKSKEVSVLVLPCRHLCLCTDCDVSIDVCPVCRANKVGTLQVYMS